MIKQNLNPQDGFDVGGGCFMRFPHFDVPSTPKDMAGYDVSQTPKQIADMFVNAVGKKVEEGRTSNQRNCALPGSQFGGGSTYHVKQEGLQYPRAGRFEIAQALQSDVKSLTTQLAVEYEIDCPCIPDPGNVVSYVSKAFGLAGPISPAFGIGSIAVSLMTRNCPA